MRKILSNQEISSLCLELSMLLHAGVMVGDALTLLSEESDKEYRDMLETMARKVDDGASLASVLRDTGRFPIYVCGLVEVGETAGRTEEALAALAAYYESRVRTDRRTKSALLYPAVMLVLMLVVIGVLLVKVLPIFDGVYTSLGGRLTGVAGGLLLLGRGLSTVMPVLWGVLILAVLFLVGFTAADGFREKVMVFWRKRFGDKGVSRKLNDARLAQALAMGMASGLLIEEALALSVGLLEDAPGAKARCVDCQSRMENGSAMGEAMKGSGLFPASACRLLELGQRSGSADTTMAKIAVDLEEEGEAALEEVVSRVEPALVLVCSVLVGLILLSVMLPLMNIMSAIG